MAGRWAAPTQQSLGWAQSVFLYLPGKWFLIFFVSALPWHKKLLPLPLPYLAVPSRIL